MQKTLKAAVTFRGTGLHTGKPVSMTVNPAVGEHGIWFKRTDLDAPDTMIRAHYANVVPSSLCTRIENASGVSVSTIEHVMAALAGCGIYNALIEIDGPEVPIVDGSAAPFMRGIVSRGIRTLTVPVRAFEVLKPVSVEKDGARAEIRPADVMQIDFMIDFQNYVPSKFRFLSRVILTSFTMIMIVMIQKRGTVMRSSDKRRIKNGARC